MGITVLLLAALWMPAQTPKVVNTNEIDVVRVSATEYPWLGDANFQKMIAGKSETMGEVVRFWQREVMSGKHKGIPVRWHVAGKIGQQHTPFTIDRLASLWTIALQGPMAPTS